MEPIGSLFSSTSLHVCAGFRHFDVETVFLYPWAVAFHTLDCWRSLKPDFVAILVIALVYAWRKGAWNGHEI